MIKLVIDLLQMDDFYGVGKNIDIAKGQNKIEIGLKGKMKQRKRKEAWRLKR
jgi:hypothetical protein